MTPKLPFNPISFSSLYTFLSVAKSGSFSETARKIGKAQSAVSTAVNNLEIDLGVKLFDRSSYRPSLTTAGAELLHHAEEIVHNLCALQEKAEALAKDSELSIRIISSSFCPLEHVYTVFEELTNRWPACQPVIDVVAPCSLEAQFRNSKNCFCISTLPTTRELQGTVTTEPVGWIGFTYVVASGHPMLRNSPLDRRVLSRYRQLALTGACDNMTRPTSSQTWVFNDLTIVLSLVEQGLGWALLPKQAVSQKIKSGTLTAINCTDLLAAPRLPYGIFWKKTQPRSQVTEFFLRRFLGAATEVGAIKTL